MQTQIHLHDVLEQMNARNAHGLPMPFQIKFFTFNRSKNTGGEEIEMKNCTLVVGKKGDEVIPVPQRKEKLDAKTSKNPNHYINGTMNIYQNDSKEIRKVHTRLISEFNHKKVTW